MSGIAGHILAVVAGALVAGILAFVLMPQLFWAGVIGGAMFGGALRVGWVLLNADDAA